ncbi:MAG: hypothetical protein OXS30_07880 [Chloroflexota bacterium]|nr:hypothetical protein [Chloroflexota bacterium]
MTTRLDLKEYAPVDCTLAPEQLDLLLRHQSELDLSIELTQNDGGAVRLTAGSTVGAVEIGDLSISIEPKIGIDQLLSLACYAIGVVKPQDQRLFDFEERRSLPDTLALALASAARRAFDQGLLHGYRTEEQALQTVRGRIRIAEQLRRRFGAGLPVELRFDEFTDDILEHQLVRAAVVRLGAMRLRAPESRRELGWVAAMLEQVSAVEFRPNDVPDVRFDRLNGHYRAVVGLARLMLRHGAYESGRGRVRASGFLVDMNRLFQEFLTVALRESLGVSEQALRADRQLPEIWLDEGDQLRLKPDLSWWDGPTCSFVGDAKYKRLADSSAPNADLYQLLAYATALDLPGGLLVYAAGETEPASFHIRHAARRLEVVSLDLSGSLETVLERVGQVAERVRVLREEARRQRCAA